MYKRWEKNNLNKNLIPQYAFNNIKNFDNKENFWYNMYIKNEKH